jgi:hypothetical protein
LKHDCNRIGLVRDNCAIVHCAGWKTSASRPQTVETAYRN